MDKGKLMHKVLKGNASPEEQRILREWVNKNAGNRQDFDDMTILYSPPSTDSDDLTMQTAESWKKIQERIRLSGVRKDGPGFIMNVGIAVIISLLLLAGLYFTKEVYQPDTASEAKLISNLFFDHESIENIARNLQTDYNIRLEVESSISGCTFTGAFQQGLTIEEMIKTLAQAKDFKVTTLSNHAFKLTGIACTY